MGIDPRQHRRLILAALLVFAAPGGQAAIAASVINKPIYNPESKSYVELVEDRITNGSQGPGWAEAAKDAERLYFKGVQGRLAVISSARSELFIATMLRPTGPTWFGVYYECENRRLRWVTGETLKKGAYANWDPAFWFIGQIFCPNNSGIMPGLISNGIYWALQMPAKHYNYYLVEYPTGGVEPVKTSAKPAEPASPAAEAGHANQNEE